ncbi:MAG TPA: sigma-70 family RNA polymerase sigma factor [Opitutaceae bacterium]|nr:sigma-70 family RNA polymerase sigma factor [Opitutaceae bacterium]
MKISVQRQAAALSDAAIHALVAERAAFHRFLSRRVGSESTADDLLQESLLRALQRGESLRRGERVVPWFYRILRHAIADHFRHQAADARKVDRLSPELDSAGDHAPRDWERAVCSCFEGLLPSIKPRYAEILRRIDLNGELKVMVARDLKMSAATLNVTLHRARAALRRRLEVFCGACSKEHCLACACDQTKRPVRKEKV